MSEKIIYIIDSVPDYINTTMYQRIQFLTRHFNVYVILMLPGFPEHFASRVKHRIYPVKRFKWLLHYFFPVYCLALIKICGWDDAKIVITSPQPLNILAGFLSKKLYGMQWIADIYDVPNLQLVGIANAVRTLKESFLVAGLKGMDKLTQQILKKADAVFCTLLPEALRRYRVDESKIIPMVNGIDVNSIPRGTKTQDRRFNVLYVGAVHARRGLKTMICSALQLKKELPDIKWNVVGPVYEKENGGLSSDQKEELNGIVEFTGEISHQNVLSFLREADVCIFPFPQNYATDYIFPIKIFEYMAMGKPIIASRLKGIQAILKDGEDALFFSPEDADALTDCIKTLFADEALRKKLGLNAKNRVSSYYWHHINEQLLITLKDIFYDKRG